MRIFFYRRFTRNPEIRNIPIWVFHSNWRLGWLSNTKFGTNVFDKMLMNAAKCHCYSFYRFWVIKGQPTERVKITQHPPTQNRVKIWNRKVKVLFCWMSHIQINSKCSFSNSFYQIENVEGVLEQMQNDFFHENSLVIVSK